MFNLTDRNLSYVIISPCSDSNSDVENNFLCEKVSNILYSKDYTVFPITSYYQGVYERSFIAICNDSNDKLRTDSIYLIDEFNSPNVIVKYKDENIVKKILNNGSERLMSVSIYDGDTDNKVYLYNGVSFAFKEEKRYKSLTSKSQLRNGMVVEFFNNDRWIERKVTDVDAEYEKLYKLLIKYEKLRVCMD